MLQVLAEGQPERFAPLLVWFDELYGCVQTCLQVHFLTNHSASLSEHYYDLVRQQEFSSLTAVKKLFSLLALTLLPYYQSKLKAAFEKAQESTEADGQRSVFSKLIVHVYPLYHTLWSVALLYYKFLFAIGKSDFHSPVYRLLGIKLARVNPFLRR